MRLSHLGTILGLVAVCGLTVVQAQSRGQTGHPHVLMSAPDLKWGPAPPGLPAGAQLAVLNGDPGKPAAFAISLKFPDGYTIRPHWHPTDENVVIVGGTMMVGTGDKFVETTLTSMGVGSYAMLPMKTSHYVRAKGAATIVVYGMGPFEITYVDPKDDPRTKK